MAASLINGRYRTAAELGSGATSRVWLVHDEIEHVDVALKLFADDLRAAAAREFQMLRALSHPGVAQARECGIEWESGRFFFTSEAVSGRDFVTAARSLASADQLLLFAHVLRVLQFLHSRGLVHRDIKPANLLVTDPVDSTSLAEHCPVRLIDFGLARFTTDCAEQGGSLPYMAPEIFDGLPASPQSDLYGFGVVVYEVLSGERLITGSSQLEMIRAHRDVPERLSRISSPCRRLLAALLAREPKARPRSARDALLELSRLSAAKIPPETQETMLARVRSAFGPSLPESVQRPLGAHGGALIVRYQSGDEPGELIAQVQALACLEGRLPVAWSVGPTAGVLDGLRQQLQGLGAQAALHGDLGAALRELSGRRPLALIAAPGRDHDLMDLQELLARWPHDPRLAIVVLLEESRHALATKQPTTSVGVLSRADLAASFASALGVPPSEELMRHLGSKPLGAGQARRALHALLASGALEVNDGEVTFFPERASTLAPPAGERERIADLMTRLSSRAREALARLVLAERPQPRRDLADDQAVPELIASGLVESSPDAMLSISSSSVRECALLGLDADEKRRAHAAIAAQLAGSSGDPRVEAERGFHLAQAGDIESAFPALVAGARGLITSFEIEQARRPIELLRELSAQRNDGRWQYQACWLEGERSLRAGEPAAAVEWLQKALCVRPISESAAAIQATLAKAHERLADYPSALKCLDEASRDPDLAPEARARLLIDRAFILYRQGRYDEAREMCLSAGRLLKGPDLQRIRFGNLMGLISRQQGMLPDAESFLRAAVADARAIHMPAFEAQALNSMANVEFAQGKVRRAVELLTEAARVLHEHGEKQQLHTLVHFNIASYALVLGDLELAREKLQLMRSFLEQQPDESGWASYELQLARLAYLEGDVQQAEALAMSCAVRQERIGERAGLGDTLSFAARWSGRSGDLARAQDLLEQARAAAAEASPNSRVLLLAATLEIALQAGGDVEEQLAQDLNDALLRADPVLGLIESDLLVRFHLARERRQVACALATRLAERCAALELDHLEAGYRALVALSSSEPGVGGELLFEAALEKLGDRAASRRVLAPLCVDYARRLMAAFRTAPLEARERCRSSHAPISWRRARTSTGSSVIRSAWAGARRCSRRWQRSRPTRSDAATWRAACATSSACRKSPRRSARKPTTSGCCA
ncbi:MAG: protein kinase [Planctomycetota bacterium]